MLFKTQAVQCKIHLAGTTWISAQFFFNFRGLGTNVWRRLLLSWMSLASIAWQQWTAFYQSFEFWK